MKLVINDITENRMSIKKSAQKHDLSNSDFHLCSKTWFNKHFFRRRGGTLQGLPSELNYHLANDLDENIIF
jgi:hypothetical protein